MKVNYETMDKLVRRLRKKLDLYITFDDDTSRSIRFTAERQIMENAAAVIRHKISFKKLELMKQIEIEQILSEKFKSLQLWSKE